MHQHFKQALCKHHSLTAKCVPAETKFSSSPVLYIGVVLYISYISHLPHPANIINILKVVVPPAACVEWICSIQHKGDPSKGLTKITLEGI
jgi:hypothetical protein